MGNNTNFCSINKVTGRFLIKNRLRSNLMAPERQYGIRLSRNVDCVVYRRFARIDPWLWHESRWTRQQLMFVPFSRNQKKKILSESLC